MKVSIRWVMVFSLVMLLGALVSCSREPVAPQIGQTLTAPTAQQPVTEVNPVLGFMRTQGENMNAQLATEGSEFRLGTVEWIVAGDAPVESRGTYVFFVDRGNKRLGSHWVPFDPRRGGTDKITYIVDTSEGATASGLTSAQTTEAIDRAMNTWNSVTCSPAFIERVDPVPGLDLGYVQYLSGLGGLPGWLADYTHAGWLPAGILPDYVIGVTYTFIWVDGNGDPTDIDNNGYTDTAFRETYYNDLFYWRINANVDVETIALHEAGHGLSQGHFGSAFLTNPDEPQELLHFNPRSLMNAAYSGVNQVVVGTDNAGHCAIWANWPN